MLPYVATPFIANVVNLTWQQYRIEKIDKLEKEMNSDALSANAYPIVVSGLTGNQLPYPEIQSYDPLFLFQ
jgi:hypothetical protein